MRDLAAITAAIGDLSAPPSNRLTVQLVGRALADLNIQPTLDQDHRLYCLDVVAAPLRAFITDRWPDIMLRDPLSEPPERASEPSDELAWASTSVESARPSERRWSAYQEAIFDEMAGGSGNMVAMARAGSGKTTTLIEGLNRMDASDTLVCAFNKSIQKELEQRAPRDVMVRTMHALGLRLHKSYYPNAQIDPDKTKLIAKEVLLNDDRYTDVIADGARPHGKLWEAIGSVRRLCSLAKNTLLDTPEQLTHLAEDHNLVTDRKSMPVGLLIAATSETLDRSLRDRQTIDFDDMIWFPYQFDYEPPRNLRFPLIMVDEAQDLNAAQIWLIKRLSCGRILAFGDECQSIYRFRGADHQAFSRLVGATNAKTLPLSISYRCARSIVQTAREACPDIEWAPDAPGGEVQAVHYHELTAGAVPGDFVLSRTNAPLIRICLDLLRRQIPATIAGRDIAKQLRAIIDASKASAVLDLRLWLRQHVSDERAVHLPEHPERYARVLDQVACVEALSEGCRHVREVKRRLDQLFSDDSPDSMVVCSSVHKAKGLERDRVWIIHDTFGFHRPQVWHDKTEERNIWYVAVTRARRNLYFVATPLGEILNGRPG
jgi:DNA helicase-2/ATP-dependent DNA helicase PcrA